MLFAHPDVVEAVVAGIPHDVLGEDVGAWVVLREGSDDDRGRPAGLLARAAGRLQGAAAAAASWTDCPATPPARWPSSSWAPLRPDGTRWGPPPATAEPPVSADGPDEPAVLVERIGAVRRLTLNRPERHNPLTPRCIRELLGGRRRRRAVMPTVRVVVIRGSGRSFSSGYGILPEDIEPGDAGGARRHRGRRARPCSSWAAGWARVWDCAIPVIAQVHGNCLAGGTDLALHCDIVVAADDARIGFPPVRSMGVPPTNMWLYHLGPQWTKRLLFTGDTVSGTEAASIGLVQAAVPGAGARRLRPGPGRADRAGRARPARRQQAGGQRGGRAHGPQPSSSASPPSTTPWPTVRRMPGPSPPGRPRSGSSRPSASATVPSRPRRTPATGRDRRPGESPRVRADCEDVGMEQRISLVTLGVTDLARERAFYERLGWSGAEQPDDEVCFFQAGGMVFGLWTALGGHGAPGIELAAQRPLAGGGLAGAR